MMGDYYIVEETTGYKYIFKLIKSIDRRQRKPFTSVSIPGKSATNNILLAIQGQEQVVDITFTIYDDGTDRSDGTAPTDVFPDGVKTIEEQMKWLLDYIHQAKIDAKWRLYGDYFPSGGLPCLIEEIVIDDKAETPLNVDCTIRVVVGVGI